VRGHHRRSVRVPGEPLCGGGDVGVLDRERTIGSVHGLNLEDSARNSTPGLWCKCSVLRLSRLLDILVSNDLQ